MLKNLVETAALIDPNRTVLHHHGERIAIGELVTRANRLARVLHDKGAEHCVYVGVNGPSVPLALFASVLAGIPFAPLNYRLSTAQRDALLARIASPLVIAEPAAGAGGTAVTPDQWWDMGTEGTAGAGPLDEVDHRTIATVLFTSGTISAPKAVPLRHHNLAAYLLNTIELMGAAPGEAALISVPPYHVAAIGATLTNLLSGRRIVYLPGFSPAEWLATVAAEGITSAMLVPTMLARIVEHLDGDRLTSSTLRSLAYGGARITHDLLAKALAAFPEADFTNAYGLTETASTIAVLGPDDHRDALAEGATPQQRARLGSVGRAIPGIEFLVRDEDGSPVPPGAPGSLFVRGDQVSGEYLGQQAGVDPDGWFATRDGAWLDEDGYLFIAGRTDDTIIRGAENIAPAEIEDVLTAHPQVTDAAVFGVPDEEWGERVVAAVVTAAAGVDATELREWVRTRLRSSRTPDEVVFSPELPYGPTGKLLRRELAARFTATTTSKSGREHG